MPINRRQSTAAQYDANGRRIPAGSGRPSSPKVSAMNFKATLANRRQSGIPLPKASFDATQLSGSSSSSSASGSSSAASGASAYRNKQAAVDATRAKALQIEQERKERRRQMKEYRLKRVAQVKRNEAMGRPGDVDFQNMIDEWRSEKGGYPRPFGELDLGPSKICVAIRTRPVNDTEKKRKQHESVSCINPRVVVHECKFAVDGITKYLENHEFEFDCTFGPQHNNDHVYRGCVSPLVAKAFCGGKATCFAFGQTGSGKTYTMAGMQERAAQELFNRLHNGDAPPGTTLHMSFFEICGVRCFDLLAENDDLVQARVQLPIREDGKGVVHVEGLSVHDLTEVHHMLQAIKEGNKRRKTSKTEVHNDSSRSHAIFQLYLRNAAGKTVGKLSLCDLAGSERGSETKHHNKERRVESAEINKSLLALKECIRALDFGLSHVPYRASKLTMILKDSFAEGGLTTMVSCISPTYAQQNHTLSTLRYTDLIKNKDVSAACFEQHDEPDLPAPMFEVEQSAAALKAKPDAKPSNKGGKGKGLGKATGVGKKKSRSASPVDVSGADSLAQAPAPAPAPAPKPSKLKKPQIAVKAAKKKKQQQQKKKKQAAAAAAAAAAEGATASAAASASPPRKFNWRTSRDPEEASTPSPNLSKSQVFGTRSKLGSRTARAPGGPPIAAGNDFSEMSLDDMMKKVAAVEKMANPRKNSLGSISQAALKPETDMTMHDLIAQAKRNAAIRRKSSLGQSPSTPKEQPEPAPAPVEVIKLEDSELLGNRAKSVAVSASPASVENLMNRPETPDAFRDAQLPQEALLEREQQLIDMHEAHIHEHAKIVEAETHLLESVTGSFDYSIENYTNKLRAILDQKEELTKVLRANLNEFLEALAKEEARWR